MRILVALDGNALPRRGDGGAAGGRQGDVEAAADAFAELSREHELVVVHGSGRLTRYPPGADGEPTAGQALELALRNRLPERDLVSVLTEVVVAGDDPAFGRPTQAVGPVYTAEEAERLERERGWTTCRDGDRCRRLVPAPEPYAIAEIRSLRVLVESGALVICASGGVPIALDRGGDMHAVEAAIDEDLTAALLARRLDADLLVLLTEVEVVHRDTGAPERRPLGDGGPAQPRGGEPAAASIGPKVEAACRFAAGTGRRAAIGALTDAARVARGEAGTQVLAAAAEPAIAAARRPPRR